MLKEDANYTSADEFQGFPFLKTKDLCDAVKVAIVGNAIDPIQDGDISDRPDIILLTMQGIIDVDIYCLSLR